MERDGDLLLNVSCSANQPGKGARKLPLRMPDGSKIEANRNLTRKIAKTHHPATSSGRVFIPNHKLPVLDEFGLSIPSDHVGYQKPIRMLPSLSERETGYKKSQQQEQQQQQFSMENNAKSQQQITSSSTRNASSNGQFNNHRGDGHHQNQEGGVKSILKGSHGKGNSSTTEVDTSSKKAKRRKRKLRDDEPKIIPKEVQAVAGGLPPSFPKHRIKKFTEEYHEMKRKQLEDGDDSDGPDAKKKRRSFVPGLNPRKREKASHLFTETTLQDLEDLHPYLAANLEQNFEIKKLTKVQSIVMPELLKTRFNTTASPREFVINSGIGTGKILSYVVPIINNLALMEPKIDRTAGIYALVLLPTRELAAKVNEIFVKLCRSFLWIVPGLLTGGERKKSEKARLRKGLNILITTPGRLIDHMEHSKSMDFTKMTYCVIADAHRLLDPERSEVAKKIAIVLRKRLPNNCVRCIVTSTYTKKLEKLSEIVVTSPKVIDAFKEFE